VILCSDDRELVPPGIPELRKAVQQDYELVSRATLRVVKTNAIEVRVSETNGWINGWIHYASADEQVSTTARFYERDVKKKASLEPPKNLGS